MISAVAFEPILAGMGIEYGEMGGIVEMAWRENGFASQQPPLPFRWSEVLACLEAQP